MNPLPDRPISRPKVGIVVLNWNGWRDTIECLESVRKLSYPDFMIILVDNGSTDDSLDRIQAWAGGRILVETDLVVSDPNDKPVPVEIVDIAGTGTKPFPKGPLPSRSMMVIKTGDNLGYAGGNNIGIQAALELGCRYVWILNNDTVVAPDSLTELTRIPETRPCAGLIGSRLFHYERPQAVQSEGNLRFLWRPSRRTAGHLEDDGEAIPVKWVGGSSLLLNRDMVPVVGLLDDAYFLFHEEVDWCVRATRKGWNVYCVPASRVWHKWGGGSSEKRVPKMFLGLKSLRLPWESFRWVMYYEARNGIYFVKKNYPVWIAPFALTRTFHLLLQVILFDKERVRRIRVVLAGTWDGLLGRMGKKRNGS